MSLHDEVVPTTTKSTRRKRRTTESVAVVGVASTTQSSTSCHSSSHPSLTQHTKNNRTRTTIPCLLQQRCDGRITGHEYRMGLLPPPWSRRRLLSFVTADRPMMDSDTTTKNYPWRPSPNFVIRPTNTTTTTSRRRRRSVTTCMDVSYDTNQFLLTGNQTGSLSIYNLWESLSLSSSCNSNAAQQQQQQQQYQFQPMQETTFLAPTSAVTGTLDATTEAHPSVMNSIVAVQWYPVDTGIFVTAASSSSVVSLWDTTNMIPVLHCHPYQFTNDSLGPYNNNNHHFSGSTYSSSIHRRSYGTAGRTPIQTTATRATTTTTTTTTPNIACMHIGLHHPLLAAVGAYQCDMTKIVDLKSGTTSHTLMVGGGTWTQRTNHTSSSLSSSSIHNGNTGRYVTAVQWSPIQSHIVATCTNGIPYLWDIRLTARPVAACLGTRLDDDPIHQDPYVSNACTSMESLISKHTAAHHPIGSSQQQYNHHRLPQQDMNTLNIKFDPTGQYLVALGHSNSKNVSSTNSQSTSCIIVFDLLSYAVPTQRTMTQHPTSIRKAKSSSTSTIPSSPPRTHPIPIYPKPRVQYTCSSIPIIQQRPILPVLFITGSKPNEQIIWISNTRTKYTSDHHHGSMSASIHNNYTYQHEMRAYPLLGAQSVIPTQHERNIQRQLSAQYTTTAPTWDGMNDKWVLPSTATTNSYINNNNNLGYGMDVTHADDDDDDDDDDFDVVDTLCGHMDRIRCGVMANQIPVSTSRTPDCTLHSLPNMTILTASDDGLIVMWEQQHVKSTSNGVVDTTRGATTNRKRPHDGGISGSRNHHPSNVISICVTLKIPGTNRQCNQRELVLPIEQY
jgi:hypothetical protein